MSAVDQSEVGLHRRLGFARYLLQLASEQQQDAEPRCYAALLSCHDALEVFLAAACAEQTWRIVCRIDSEAVVIADVFSKKTQKTPQLVINTCRRRLRDYDRVLGGAQ